MSEDFDPEAAAAVATGADQEPDQNVDDDRRDDHDDVGEESDDWDVGETIGALMVTLIAADERGPTAPTFQERLDVDEGVAQILDGVIDIVLDVVDVGEQLGDTIGPLAKIGIGVSRLSGNGVDGADQEASDDVSASGQFSDEAEAVIGGSESV
jgi:hypothetical protein